MFNFKVQHIKGKDNIVIDALLYLPITEEAIYKQDKVGNINEFVNS